MAENLAPQNTATAKTPTVATATPIFLRGLLCDADISTFLCLFFARAGITFTPTKIKTTTRISNVDKALIVGFVLFVIL